MRSPSILLSILWIIITIGFFLLIIAQGHHIGGIKYFVHVGMASGVIVECLLAVAAMGISIGFLSNTIFGHAHRKILHRLSMAVSIGTAITFVSFLPLPTTFSVIAHFVIPIKVIYLTSNYIWVPIAAFLLGAITVTLTTEEKTP